MGLDKFRDFQREFTKEELILVIEKIKSFKLGSNRPDNFPKLIDYYIGGGSYEKLYEYFKDSREKLQNINMEYLEDKFESIIEDVYDNGVIMLCFARKETHKVNFKMNEYSGFYRYGVDKINENISIDIFMCETILNKLYYISESSNLQVLPHKCSKAWKLPIELLMKYSTPSIIMNIRSRSNFNTYDYDKVVIDFDNMMEVIKDEVDYNDVYFLNKWDPNHHTQNQINVVIMMLLLHCNQFSKSN